MVDDGWSVAPDQVAGVLAAVDRAGEPLQTAVTDARALVEDRSVLVMSGRQVMADAWQDFLSTRENMPGKVIEVVSSSASGVVDGVVAIATGDDTMAQDWRGKRADLFGSTEVMR